MSHFASRYLSRGIGNKIVSFSQGYQQEYYQDCRGPFYLHRHWGFRTGDAETIETNAQFQYHQPVLLHQLTTVGTLSSLELTRQLLMASTVTRILVSLQFFLDFIKDLLAFLATLSLALAFFSVFYSDWLVCKQRGFIALSQDYY